MKVIRTTIWIKYLSILIVAITWLSTSNNLEVYACCNIIITGSSWSLPVMTRFFPCVGSLTILFTAVSSQIRSTKKSRCQYLITFQCWSWDKEIWRRLPGRCMFLLASQSTSLWLWNLKRSLGIGRTVSLQIQLKHWTVKVEVSQRACNSDCSELYQISQRSTSNLP